MRVLPSSRDKLYTIKKNNYYRMKTDIEKTIPYSEMSYATLPTSKTKFWRHFVPLQIIRFFVLNLKIMKIVVGGHS